MKQSELKSSHCILVCTGDKCCKKGKKLKQALADALAEADLDDRVAVHTTGCMHRCDSAPTATVYPDGIAYGKVSKKGVDKIVKRVAKAVAKT